MIFWFQIAIDLVRMQFSTRWAIKVDVDGPHHGAVLWWGRIR